MTINSQKNFAFDDAVPQRERLLNTQEAAEYFGQFGDVDLCERVRAKYRIGKNLRVVYRVQIGGKSQIVACRTVNNGVSEKYSQQAKAVSHNTGNLPAMFYASDLQTAYWTFPNDRRIKGLDLFDNPSNAILPEWKKSRLMAYAPEQRATFRCLGENDEVLAYAKIYGKDGGETTYRLHKQLENAPFLLPRAIQFENSTLLLSAIEGPMISQLSGEELLSGIEKLGAALALVHLYPPPAGLAAFDRLELSKIKSFADAVGRVRPDVQPLLEELLKQLVSKYSGATSRKGLLHGDVHPKNAVMNGEQTFLIDFDQSGIGDISADIGSFLASLRYSRITESITEAEEKAHGEKFLQGYSSISELPNVSSIRWHLAASLFAERALRAVSRIRQSGLLRLGAIVRESIEILEGKGGI